MKRIAHEPVTVTAGPLGQPHGFRWRGRGYLVREVLASWHEGPQWWREQDAGDGWPGDDPFWGDSQPGRTRGADYRFWRVAAQRSPAAASGIYDLVEMQQSWWLSQLWD